MTEYGKDRMYRFGSGDSDHSFLALLIEQTFEY